MDKVTTHLEQLLQLKTVTWDGDLISKSARDELHIADLIRREAGWNVISKAGIRLLVDLRYLKPESHPREPKNNAD